MSAVTFLGSPRRKLDELSSNIAVLGIPVEEGGIFRKGTSRAPNALRRASLLYSYKGFAGLYDPERDSFILTDGKLVDVGDIRETGKRKNIEEKIRESVRKILLSKSVPLCLGGNHSITYPILSAYSEDLEVLHLDAHSDFQRYDESDASPCGTVMRKVSDLPHVKRIVHVGIRGYLNSSKALKDTKLKGNAVITASELRKKGARRIIKELNPNLPYYISFDSDFLDPSVCPGTTVPEPGGASFDLAQNILTGISKRNRIIGIDCVEANPLYDRSQISEISLNRLLIGLIGVLK